MARRAEYTSFVLSLTLFSGTIGTQSFGPLLNAVGFRHQIPCFYLSGLAF